MKAPASKKDIQIFNDMLNALNMFISIFAQLVLPFYRLLRKQIEFKWNSKWNDAFESLKKRSSLLPDTYLTIVGVGLVALPGNHLRSGEHRPHKRNKITRKV